MAKTVSDAFDTLISWVKPSEVETAAAASHRASIEASLKANFGMTNFFRAGSFGHGTSVSGHSDVDYFAVCPSSVLKINSATTLREFKDVLSARFPNTGVYINSPAVAVPFGKTRAEHHEVIPADLRDSTKSYRIYEIPDRASGWMLSAPLGHNAYTNTQNDRLSGKAKQLIRLVKLWNCKAGAGIRSIYIELRVAEYLAGESSIVYPIDVKKALKHMHNKGLAAMQDPLGLTGYIQPCTDAAKPEALSKLNTAIGRAEKALAAGMEGKTSDAFYWWSTMYFSYFPAYG